jgi:hypothetical protein
MQVCLREWSPGDVISKLLAEGKSSKTFPSFHQSNCFRNPSLFDHHLVGENRSYTWIPAGQNDRVQPKSAGHTSAGQMKLRKAT